MLPFTGEETQAQTAQAVSPPRFLRCYQDDHLFYFLVVIIVVSILVSLRQGLTIALAGLEVGM